MTVNNINATSVNKEFLSTKEAVKAWGISRYMIRELVDNGALVPMVFGKKNWKFHREDYQDLLLSQRQI